MLERATSSENALPAVGTQTERSEGTSDTGGAQKDRPCPEPYRRGAIFFASGFIAVLALTDWSLDARIGIRFSGWTEPLGAIALLCGAGLFYELIGDNDRFANIRHYAALLYYTALWIAFALTGAILTYLAASARMPLWDAELYRLDTYLGFYPLGAYFFVHSHEVLQLVLGAAYLSFSPQILLSIIYFALVWRNDRNADLLISAMIALTITAAVSALIPAVSPYPFLTGKPLLKSTKNFLIVRSTTHPTFQLSNLQGIVTFPSYHTVMAILLVYSHRPPLKSFAAVLALNIVMLIAVPVEGSHYLADMIAAVPVAAISIVATRKLLAAFDRPGASTGAVAVSR